MTTERVADEQDFHQNKVMAILAYLLFFIPLIAAKDSVFAKYHANQGLILFIYQALIWTLTQIIPIFGWAVISPIGNLIGLAFLIIGMLNANKGLMKPLPIIGGFNIIN
ncbi:Uncharacterized membrane protein [Amphibacillus marinus]|uniref:Uncharacterized membrane protein n=1 Tax=Amphibacillus marinus TaxID=872970 RepID=A0A1H8SSR8_9BACI|nr:hypothetical protein [Amphibacillus marinus]SEO81213.1 Uncharacterized membrane protein [Amphibacillus marinus]